MPRSLMGASSWDSARRFRMALYWVWSGWILGDGSNVHCYFPVMWTLQHWLNSANIG